MATKANNVALLTQDPAANSNAALISMAGGGPTESRPNNPPLWFHYFDITLQKGLVWTGLDWTISSGGPQGGTGSQGVQGAVGVQGFQGFQGSQGSIGAQGPIGQQGGSGGGGPQGAQGATGAQGFQGTAGGVSTAKFTTIEARSAGNSTIGHACGVNVGGTDGSTKLVAVVTTLSDGALPSGITLQIYSGASVIQTRITDGSTTYYSFVVGNPGNSSYVLVAIFPTTSWEGIKSMWGVVGGTAYFNNGSCRGAVVGSLIAGPFAIRLAGFGTPANTLINNARFVATVGLAPIPLTTSNLNGDTSNNPRGSFSVTDEIILIGTPSNATAQDAICDFNF